jgi:hypothetical protein
MDQEHQEHQEQTKPKLTLHCGAHGITMDVLEKIVEPGEYLIDSKKYLGTPEPTSSHIPIPHLRVQKLVRDTLQNHGYEITGESHALGRFGQRYFGLFQVTNQDLVGNHPDCSWMVGVRNSHDKAFPAAVAAGTRVFVCDNLSFSGAIKIAHKHTSKVLQKLPELVDQGIDRLALAYKEHAERIEAYQDFTIKDSRASFIIMRAFESGIISTTKLSAVWNQWVNPSHEDFKPRNAWSLFNAFTEVLKHSSLWNISDSTSKLHNMLDALTGVVEAPSDVLHG